jgi:sugar transferase (PEP-CTERM/EpsH1 system associated)
VKILVLTSRFPYPLEKGDKLRIYYQIRELHRAGHEICLIALTEEPLKDVDYQKVKTFCSQIFTFSLSRFSIASHILSNILRGRELPFQVAYFYDSKVQKAINQIIETEKPDHIYCHLARMSPYIEDLNLPKTLDFMDAFGAGTLRRAEISSLFLRPFWRFEARLMTNYEQKIASKFDFSTIISEQDKQRLPLTIESKEVYMIPNGVDVDFFDIADFQKGKNTIEKKYDICFVGNLGYYSNVEAIRFLVKKILPLVIEQKRDIKILLAGARPTAEIERLDKGNIKVVGWLDDIREAYAESRILVAPLMHGIGQQNKILEAMSMNVPVITTSRVNKAIGAIAGKEILLADTERGFAEQILNLLQDADLQKNIEENGRDFVIKNYSWTHSMQIFINLLKSKICQKQPN